MNILFAILDVVLLVAAIAFLIVDPSNTYWTNMILATIAVTIALHIFVNWIAICRGSWCFKC